MSDEVKNAPWRAISEYIVFKEIASCASFRQAQGTAHSQ